MKKLLSTLVVLSILIPFLALGAGNETTYTVPSADASFLTDLQNFLRNEDAARQAETEPGQIVVSGGTHSTSGTKTSAGFATTAYTTSGNRIVQASAAINYGTLGGADNDVCWTIASASALDNLDNFTRVTGTDYFVDCTSSLQPTLPADSVWLMRVTLAAAAISVVQDLRFLGAGLATRFNSHGSTSLLEEMQAYWGAQAVGFIESGCLHATAGGTSATIASCKGYAQNTTSPVRLEYFEETASRSVTYSGGNGTYWLIAHTDRYAAVTDWTRIDGTHYLWRINATKPTLPSRSVFLAKVTVDAGAISAVEDMRHRVFNTVEVVAANYTTHPDSRWTFLPGGQLSVDNGVTVTHHGTITAPEFQQIFAGASTTPVILRSQAARDVRVEWFGAVGDPDTPVDDGPAFQRTFNAIATVQDAAVIQLPLRRYMINTPVVVPAEFESLTFRGHNFSAFKTEIFSNANIAIFSFVATEPNVGNALTIEDLTIVHLGSGANTAIFDFVDSRMDHVVLSGLFLAGTAGGDARYGIKMGGSSLVFDFLLRDSILAFFTVADVWTERLIHGTFIGNHFIDSASADKRLYIGDTSGSGLWDAIVIANNIFHLPANSIGVHLEGNPGAITRGVLVSNNSFKHGGGATNGIAVQIDHDGVKNITLVGNNVEPPLTRLTSSGTITTSFTWIDEQHIALYTDAGARIIDIASTGLSIGAGSTTVKRLVVADVAINPASIAANSRGAITFTLTGAAVGDSISMQPPAALHDDLLFVGCRVTGADQGTVYLYNPTGAPIDDAETTWTVTWMDHT